MSEQNTTPQSIEPRVDDTSIYAPQNFLELVHTAVQLDLDQDNDTLRTLTDFARDNPVVFLDTVTPEDQLKSITKSIDSEIGDFLQGESPMRGMHMCDMLALNQLSEIYNAHNLLALACNLVEQAGGVLTAAHADILYRYRVVLHRVYEARCSLQSTTEEEVKAPKVGARTWAGDVHSYACETGILVEAEYFDLEPQEELPYRSVKAGDETIIVRGARRIET